MERSSCIVAS